MDENLAKYHVLLRKLQRTVINDRFRAVHFIRREKWVGSGTIVNDRKDIITCEHIFPPEEPSDYLSYQVLQPFESVTRPICRFTSNGEHDIGMATPGKPELIHYKSKLTVSEWTSTRSTKSFSLKQIQICMHLATGDAVRILGYMTDSSGATQWLLEYDAGTGESGSGFIRNRGQIFVLRGSMLVTDEIRKFFSISNEFRAISLATAIDVP